MDAHYFLAVPVTNDVSISAGNWCSLNKDRLSFKNWVVPEDYHITLFFLGSASDKQLDSLKEKMHRIAAATIKFKLQINQFGFFGEKKSPRIFWLGIAQQPALNLLQAKVTQACAEAGFKTEDRHYNPHITLARRWQASGQSFPLPLWEEEKDFFVHQNWSADEMVLFRSHLDRLPKYESVDKFIFQ